MAGSPRKSPKKARRPKKAAVHPPVKAMVVAAIKALKDRKGSSLIAIKKYIAGNFRGCDMTRLSPFIKKCLKNGVAAGLFKQTTGTGASGRFRIGKIPAAPKKKAKKPKKKAKKPKKAKKAKKPKAKKAKKPKAKKAKKAKKPKAAKKAKKPKAAKKAKKPKAAKKSKAKKAAKK